MILLFFLTRNVRQYPEAEQEAGLLLVRLDAPLYFANVHYVRDRLRKYEERSQVHILDPQRIVGCRYTRRAQISQHASLYRIPSPPAGMVAESTSQLLYGLPRGISREDYTFKHAINMRERGVQEAAAVRFVVVDLSPVPHVDATAVRNQTPMGAFNPTAV